MSVNQVLEDGNSEEDDTRVYSLRKKELEGLLIRTVDRRILQVIEQTVNRKIHRVIEQTMITIDRRIHQVIEQNMAPMISRIVKQELESAGEKFCARLNHHSGIGAQSSESRTLQLKFMDKLSLPVLTNQPIKGEGNTPFRVALVDVTTKQVVTEASAMVEIVVVEGDFDGDNWTVEEFNKKIVREKEGKKSLLTGNVHLNLEAGVGFISEISFTHNSHWMKVCKLRLGAKVVDNYNGARVREAVTEPFVLKDFRNTYTKKHLAPSLNDEVWRLKNIGKDGPLHHRLGRENIKTVKDLLTRFFVDPQSLRNILGTAKTWEAIVNHAQKCVLDKSLHLYFPIGSEKKCGVVFNVVGQVMGLISECCYSPLNMLSEDQKADAKKLVVSAIKHTEEVKSFDDENCLHSHLQSLNNAYPLKSPRVESPSLYSCEPSQTHYGHDHTQPSTSSHNNQVVRFNLHDDANPSNIPSIDSLGFMSSVPSFGNASHLHENFWQSIIAEELINEEPLIFPENLLNPSICCTESTSLQLVDTDNSLQYQYLSSEAREDLNMNGFLSSHDVAPIAQRRWTMLSTVLWFMRRIATVKLVSSEAVHASKRPRIY